METPSFSSLHALVLPLPVQGHINPLLSLPLQLAIRGSTITFVNTERAHDRILAARPPHQSGSSPNVRFVTIPDGFPRDSSITLSHSTLMMILEGIEKQQAVVEELVQESSKSDAPPISCIISDSFFTWTQQLANRLRISRVLFWTSNMTTLHIHANMAMGKIGLEGTTDAQSEELLPGLPFRKKDIHSRFPFDDPERLKFVRRRFADVQDCACILVNTFHELESSLLSCIPFDIPVRFVGPLLPPEFLNDGRKSEEDPEATSVRANLLKEDNCLQWLDTQVPSSVLYISFGSAVTLPLAQLEKLALGIEASKQPFLWVARAEPEGSSSSFPDGFLDRTKDQGLVISWAPQLQVLRHRATGGFLTHCGWNSMLESMAMGVPMVGWPVFADQSLNLLLAQEQWKVGMEFRKEGDEMVDVEEVERVVRALMQSGEGSVLRERCRELNEVARSSTTEGGSSCVDLELFLSDVVQTLQRRRSSAC